MIEQQTRTRTSTPARWIKAAERAIAKGVMVFQVAGGGQWIATSGTSPQLAGDARDGEPALGGISPTSRILRIERVPVLLSGTADSAINMDPAACLRRHERSSSTTSIRSSRPMSSARATRSNVPTPGCRTRRSSVFKYSGVRPARRASSRWLSPAASRCSRIRCRQRGAGRVTRRPSPVCPVEPMLPAPAFDHPARLDIIILRIAQCINHYVARWGSTSAIALALKTRSTTSG